MTMWTGIFAVVNTVMNFGVLYRAGNFFLSEQLSVFQGGLDVWHKVDI